MSEGTASPEQIETPAELEIDPLKQQVENHYAKEWDQDFGDPDNPKNEERRKLFIQRRTDEVFQAAEDSAQSEEKGLKDELTGLPTRTLFRRDFNKIKAAIDRGVEADVYLGIVDLDHFKSINDSLGHDAGDVVLKKAAGGLETGIRPYDSIYRIGGEEFAILIVDYKDTHQPNSKPLNPLEFAQGLIQRIKNTVAEEPVNADGALVKEQTASMGIAKLNKDDNIDTFFKRADTAVYFSKENGRNQANMHRPDMQAKPDKVA